MWFFSYFLSKVISLTQVTFPQFCKSAIKLLTQEFIVEKVFINHIECNWCIYKYGNQKVIRLLILNACCKFKIISFVSSSCTLMVF